MEQSTYTQSMDYIFVTVEDYTGAERIDCVVEEVIENQGYDLSIYILEQSSSYFVIKVEYMNFEDVKDVCANITHLLLQYGIYSFRMNCAGEDCNDY